MNKYLPRNQLKNINHADDRFVLLCDRRFSHSFIVVHKKIVKTDTEIIQINILTDPAFVPPIFCCRYYFLYIGMLHKITYMYITLHNLHYST